MQEGGNQGARALELGDLIFSGKIDYVSVRTERKVKLSGLAGHAIWPRPHNGHLLTVHDATAKDVACLVDLLGAPPLVEVEVAVDVRPAPHVPHAESEALLQAVMVELFARGLNPSNAPYMLNQFRAFYRRLDGGYIIRPFNRKLPRSTDQQLHGGRHDAAQVKAYLKTRDDGRLLDARQRVARVEVCLRAGGLAGHELETLHDLLGFKYRKHLMPYFRHVSGPAQRKAAASNCESLLTMMYAKQHEFNQVEYQRCGVGAFLPGGKRDSVRAPLKRDIQVNDRIGQALMRLENQFRRNEFVREEHGQGPTSPMLARLPGQEGQSSMTNQ